MRRIQPQTRLQLALAVLAALSVAAACRAPEEKPQPSAAPSLAAQRGGTVVAGWTSDPVGVNEYVLPSSQVTSEVIWRLFLHLLAEQPDFTEHPPTFAPQLAQSYEWSADHKVLTFKLHPDAVWSDGVPVTAEDVRWTWQVQTNPDIAWDDAPAKVGIEDVEVVDPHTVRFHFSRVYAKQLNDANEGVIIPQHAWSKLPLSEWRQNVEWFRRNLVCNGPFTLGAWESQQQVELVRNERYHVEGRPYLDRFVMRIVPDAASLVTQLESGALDFVPQVNPKDVARLEANPKLDVITYWVNLYVAVAWNNQHPLLSDPEVRRALTLALDRETIVETVLGEYGRVGVTPILTSVWAHDKSLRPLPFDPAEAKRILAAKGWKDSDGDGVLDKEGKPFALEVLSNAGNQQRNDAAVMIQDQLRKIGVRAQAKVIEFNTLITKALSGDYQAAIVGLSMDTSLDVSANFHTRAIDHENNYSRYANPELDALLDKSVAQPDYQAALPVYQQIERILHRDQPMTVLWESKRLTGINRRVQNARPNLLQSLINLDEWWVKPDA